jgi:hypothetical protein
MRLNGALSCTRGEQESVLECRRTALESAALHDGRGAGYGEVPEGTGFGERLLRQGKASERSDYAPQGPGLGPKTLGLGYKMVLQGQGRGFGPIRRPQLGKNAAYVIFRCGSTNHQMVRDLGVG